MNSSNNKKFFCKPLFYILVALALISTLAISSAAPLINPAIGSPTGFWMKQLMWYSLGFIAMFIVYQFSIESIYHGIWYVYYFLIFLLIILLIHHQLYYLRGISIFKMPFVQSINGATSWFVFPGIGSIQPSEFMKMVLIICLSEKIHQHNEEYPIHTFDSDLIMIGKVLMTALPPCLLIYLQNDAGVTLIMLTSIVFILFASGLQMRWFIVGVIGVVSIIGIFVYLFIFQPDVFKQIISGHKADRFYGWLDPEGTIGEQGYQLFNALLSYGTASFFGHGFRSYVMYFPEAQTDFIFAVIVQGAGLTGGLIVLALILALDLVILYIGIRADNKYKYMISGLFGLLFFQQIWNISMVIGLLPITGITLPFISYGGSSLLSYMLVMGMLLDIEKQNRFKKSKNITYQM